MANLLEGLFAGRAGVQSHGAALSIISDNIANTNTTGYKASRADFIDILAGNIGGQNGSNIAGTGSYVPSSTTIYKQGTQEKTGRELDAAIDGNGFFILKDENGVTYYSRAGNLSIGNDGYVRSQTGLYVQGYAMNGAGGIGPLSINTVSSYSSPTSKVTISGNLSAGQLATKDMSDPTALSYTTWEDLTNNASLSTFVDVYDSLGAVHTLTILFFKQEDSSGNISWISNAYIDGSEIKGKTAGTPVLMGSNYDNPLTFDENGARPASNPPSDDDLVVNMSNPDSKISASKLEWANGATNSEVKMCFEPMTQYDNASYINSITQNGFRSGNVESISIAEDGTLVALLNNGQKVGIGTIALAVFANQEGLVRAGDSRFVETYESGQAVIGVPGTGKYGRLVSQCLELSTTDLADEFVKLIVIQRGFQGCSRIIGKMDELLGEIIGMVN
ncbi:MAG: flagellar hook-basal body complex protein [Deltaproteobacteria bacterium]|jgi:flagellar hook protein FlgE|nr:flagellar hook-basal body complex protein [Deltaproteobacteria bacterium]